MSANTMKEKKIITANFLMLVELNFGWLACFDCIIVYSSFVIKIDISKQYI